MAFALRITAKTKNGKEVEIEPSWWNIDQLRSTHSFQEDISDYYLDYYLDVDIRTFKDIMEGQEKYRKKGVYGYKDWIEENDHTKDELVHLVQNLLEGTTIKIWIYEWETGLD